ncbi:MAG: hypothetical protein ACK56F_23305, partial [bacterium]
MLLHPFIFLAQTLQLQGLPAQLHLHHHLSRQTSESENLLVSKLSRAEINGTQTAHRKPIDRDKREARI